jgi:hypothetical protein
VNAPLTAATFEAPYERTSMRPSCDRKAPITTTSATLSAVAARAVVVDREGRVDDSGVARDHDAVSDLERDPYARSTRKTSPLALSELRDADG